MAKNTISEDDAKIIEEMQEVQVAPEPGTDGLKESLSEGVEGFEGKPKIKWLSSAGYVYVWDNQTGERSTINRNMLSTQLKKRRPDGSRIFTTVDPKIPVKSGNLKCMLHRKDPNRKHYDELGLPYCRKGNLTSPYQVKRHMQKRHPQEWATIQEEITRKEKEEERQFREALMKGAAKK
jgi:hypothetical protein